jgi:hypothetical protein
MKPFRTIMRRAVLFVPEVLIPSVILLMLTGGTYALAQNARDVLNLFNTLMRAAPLSSGLKRSGGNYPITHWFALSNVGTHH